MPDLGNIRPFALRVGYVAAALAVLAASAWALARRVQEPVWPAAAALVRNAARPDELTVLLPAAAAQEARHFLGLPVVAGMPTRPEAFAGLWVVAGAEASPALRDALRARFRQVEEHLAAGRPVEHLVGPRTSRFDLVRQLGSAEVLRRGTDAAAREERCRKNPAGRHDCPGLSWKDVFPKDAGFRGVDARGIWLHPVEGTTTVLHWPAVARGEVLLLRLGLDDAARTMRRAFLGPVEVRAKAGDVRLGAWSVWPHDGLRTLTLPLPALSGDTFALTIETTAARDFYANLLVLGEVLE